MTEVAGSTVRAHQHSDDLHTTLSLSSRFPPTYLPTYIQTIAESSRRVLWHVREDGRPLEADGHGQGRRLLDCYYLCGIYLGQHDDDDEDDDEE